MIYDEVLPEAPVRQGDVFQSMPKVDFSLNEVVASLDGEPIQSYKWEELVGRLPVDTPALVQVAVTPVLSLVLTQDCDAARSSEIVMARVMPWRNVNRGCPKPEENWTRFVVSQSRENYKLFYLPIDERFGINERSVVDFRFLLSVPLDDLLLRRQNLRRGRLNDTAIEHFRERAGAFFRRYAYDEWYSLDAKEFASYKNSQNNDPSIQPYPWQNK